MRSIDRVGLLRDVTSMVSGENVNIASCVSEEYDNVSIITLTLHVSGINQLSRLFFKLESVKGGHKRHTQQPLSKRKRNLYQLSRRRAAGPEIPSPSGLTRVGKCVQPSMNTNQQAPSPSGRGLG